MHATGSGTGCFTCHVLTNLFSPPHVLGITNRSHCDDACDWQSYMLLHSPYWFLLPPQVLGITNYSHWGDAGHMRQCMWRSPTARQHLLDVAVRRVNKFFHVGVTDRLADSVAAAGVSEGLGGSGE